MFVVIVVVTGPAGVIVLCLAIVSLAGSNLLLSENAGEGGEGRLLSLSCDSPRASTQLDAVVGVAPRYFFIVLLLLFSATPNLS